MSTLMEGSNALGRRVKAERARRGWSLARFADASGVSRAMISKIERGESNPTAVVLGKLSAALELSMTALLSPADGAAAGRVRRAADTPRWTDPDTGYLRRQISTPGFPVDVTEIVLPAGARVPMPAGSYAFIAQLIWVLDGELTLVDGAAAHRLSSGDTFELGEPQAREFVNDTAEKCRYVVVVTRKATA
ncbi:helix-turn-helix domain-containing protein [Actinomadura montaniterrae]|uniref:Helix-turn-helix transcriptional regulator n=1 Tax=Actinomadura montaniterrae TaxID=1803903 RepID=A0A6L3W1T1_9ACTN|nr:helix-turn-helix domain-containing protein [Actinomadura montaniterrae]KAB2388811.1 helix-turn-helix transcriptional regulator [Actinomadura montaniterrae]